MGGGEPDAPAALSCRLGGGMLGTIIFVGVVWLVLGAGVACAWSRMKRLEKR